MSFKKRLSLGLATLLIGASSISHGMELDEATIGIMRYEENAIIRSQGLDENYQVTSQSLVVRSEAKLKQEIHRNMVNRANSFSIAYELALGVSEVSSLVGRLYDEIMLEDEYLAGHLSGTRWGVKGYSDSGTIEITASYTSTKVQEDFVDSEIERIHSEIIRHDMTEFEKVKAINDYIVLNTEYSTSLPAGVSQHSAYAVLKEGRGVCSGYALSALRLLERAGIEARYITGYAKEPHGWNLIKIDGYWYHLDTTWNDPTPDRKGLVSYRYFLAPDSVMRLSHSWESSNYPSATNNKYSWIRSLGDSTITVRDTIYFGGDSLQSIGLDGSKINLITPDRAPFFAVAGDVIYFSNYSRGGHLYKVGTDGNNQEQVNSVQSTDIYLEGNRVYYTDMNTNSQRYIEVDIVEPSFVENILVDRQSLRLELDGEVKVSAEPYPADAENAELVWRSINSRVAVVDNEGNIKAVSPGETAIVVSTSDNSISKIIVVNVNNTYDGFRRWAHQTNVPSNKDWTIAFNQDLSQESVKPENVYVIDVEGNKIENLELELSSCKRLVNISPKSNYASGTYYLTVKNLRSESGRLLNQNVRMKFTV